MRYRFQYRRYRLPFRVTVRTAHGPWAERDGVFVRLANERGDTGFGEASPIPWFGTETADEIEAACRELGEWVDNTRLASVPSRLGCLCNAIAAARKNLQETIAEKDAEDRKAHTMFPFGVPPGKTRHTALGVAALLPAGRSALAHISSRAEIGFRVFKWKVGVGDLADELALLDDVCAALPGGSKLRLDANGALDRRGAERWLERCAERPIEFLEQPIAADARGAADALLGLAGDYPTPLALDESLIHDGDVARWVGAGWPGVYVVKPALLSDVAHSIAQLEKAKAAVVFSSALETVLGARAALRWAFAWTGEARALGFGVWPLFEDARFDAPFVAPFIRRDDVAQLNPEAAWNALS